MSSVTEGPKSGTEDPEAQLFRTVRGYYETKALLALWRTGLLQRAGTGEPLKLTELTGGDYDEELLVALLDYLTVRGYLLRDQDVYTLTERGAALVPYYGYLGTMVGAYEPVMAAVEGLITGRKTFGRDVHRSVPDLATGLTSLEDNLMDHFPSLLRDREFTRVMDLGCGSGRMLCRIVGSRDGVTGVGVDANEEICAVARATVAAEHLADRVTVVQGDAGQVSRIPSDVSTGVDLVTIMFVLHELLRQRGRDGVVTCLKDIASVLGPQGTLLAVEVESAGEPVARDDLLFIPEYEFTHVLTRQRLATKAEWRALAHESGFELERIEPLRMCRAFCMVLTPTAGRDTTAS